MREKTIYTTADGREFNNKDKALQWEKLIAEGLCEYIVNNNWEALDPIEIAIRIVARWDTIQSIINKPNQRRKELSNHN